MKLRSFAGLAGIALLLAAPGGVAFAEDIVRDEIRLDSPERFDFGRANVGQEVRRTVTVTYQPFDAAAAKVTLDAPDLSGDFPVCLGLNCVRPKPESFRVAEDGCTGKQLAPGESCKLTMAFTPVSPQEPGLNADVIYGTRLRVGGSRPYLNSTSHVEARATMVGTVINTPNPNPGDANANTDKAYDYIEKLMPGMFKPIAPGSFYSRCYERSTCLGEQGGTIYLYNGQSMTPVVKVEDVLKLIGTQP